MDGKMLKAKEECGLSNVKTVTENPCENYWT